MPRGILHHWIHQTREVVKYTGIPCESSFFSNRFHDVQNSDVESLCEVGVSKRRRLRTSHGPFNQHTCRHALNFPSQAWHSGCMSSRCISFELCVSAAWTNTSYIRNRQSTEVRHSWTRSYAIAKGITGLPETCTMLTRWSEMTALWWSCSKHSMANSIRNGTHPDPRSGTSSSSSSSFP